MGIRVSLKQINGNDYIKELSYVLKKEHLCDVIISTN